MNVPMTDYSFKSLAKRCLEKEKQGYEYVTPIKKLQKPTGTDTPKYQVIMRKIEE